MIPQSISNAARRIEATGRAIVRWHMPQDGGASELAAAFDAGEIDRETYETRDGLETVYFSLRTATAPIPSHALRRAAYPGARQ
jgi:hypothetical protein